MSWLSSHILGSESACGIHLNISVKFTALRLFSLKSLNSGRHMWTEASSETRLYVMSVNVTCVLCAEPH